MAEDLGERSEEPTPRRLQQARSDGKVARSQELSSAMMLLAGTLIAAVAIMPMLNRFKAALTAVLSGDMLGNPVKPADAFNVVAFVARTAADVGLPILLITAVVAYFVQFWQVGWLFSPRALQPKLSKLDPVKGFKKLFDLSALFKTGMAIVKTVVIVTMVAVTIMQYRRDIVTLAYLMPMQSAFKAGLMLLDMAMRLVALLLLLGVIDLFYQRWKYKQDLKMTKHEVKDEMKQVEGDPQVKRRRARMAFQISMQRINATVPQADVVVTNPEHVSVAIKYDAERMNAPVVVAKGADFIALRIRQLALINSIPIIERPPLARALYRQVIVGQEIPPDFYNAVAEILAYVYQLEGGRVAS